MMVARALWLASATWSALSDVKTGYIYGRHLSMLAIASALGIAFNGLYKPPLVWILAMCLACCVALRGLGYHSGDLAVAVSYACTSPVQAPSFIALCIILPSILYLLRRRKVKAIPAMLVFGVLLWMR